MIEPVCQASLIRAGKRLVFSNPASTKRERMTVRMGEPWSRANRYRPRGTPELRQPSTPVPLFASSAKALVVHEGPAAYSSLAAVRGGVGLLYERGEKSPYERITFTRLRLGWLH